MSSYEQHLLKDVIHSSHECYTEGYNDGYLARREESKPKNTLDAYSMIIDELRSISDHLSDLTKKTQSDI